jgi:hypothetical protein
MTGWKANGSTLLVVGSGWALDPVWLWRKGFDVTVIDRAADFSSMEDSGNRKITWRQGAPEALPFENGTFDYAMLNHRLFASRERWSRQDILQEALRVATRSVLVLEWNRLFSGGLKYSAAEGGATPGSRGALPCAYPWEMLSLLRQCCPERKTTWLSTMLCGHHMAGKLLLPVQTVCLPVPLGALIGVRIDWQSATGSALLLLDRARERLSLSAGEREGVMGQRDATPLVRGTPSPSRIPNVRPDGSGQCVCST